MLINRIINKYKHKVLAEMLVPVLADKLAECMRDADKYRDSSDDLYNYALHSAVTIKSIAKEFKLTNAVYIKARAIYDFTGYFKEDSNGKTEEVQKG